MKDQGPERAPNLFHHCDEARPEGRTLNPQDPEPFVGRGWERRELAAAIAGAADSRGGLVLVGGEPGIGKTRLVREEVSADEAVGYTLVWAACWNGDDAPPYWPWVQLVRRLHPVIGSDEAAGRRIDRAALATLVPELGDRPAPEGPSDHAAARARLFEAVVGLLHSATTVGGPLVVVFDDLHWADEPSLLLLRHLAAVLPGLPLTVVGTYRDTEVHLDAGRRKLFVDLARAGREIRLAGLDSADLAVLVAGSVEGAVSTAWVDTLTERTAGNPFFAKEVLRLLAARGDAGHSLASVPPSVVEVVVQRLARLPQFVSEVLEIAAVIGEGFTVGDISRLGCPPPQVVESLDVAARARLLLHRDDGFRFIHALVQQALYENLGPGRRAQLHQAVGRAFESAGHPAEVLARHFLAAAALGETERGVHYALRAGEAALTRLAHEDAAAWFDRILRLVSPEDDRAGVDALLGRAEVYRRGGDREAARADLAMVVVAARRCADPVLLARAALGMAGLGSTSGDLQPELVGLLEEAAAGLGEDEPDLRALVLSALATELWDHARDRLDDARGHSLEALALAERGTPATLARCLEARYAITWTPDAAGERVGLAQRMAEVARASGDLEPQAIAQLLHATALLELADPQWRDALERFLALGSALPVARLDYLVLARRAAVAVMEGDFDRAAALIDDLTDLGRRIAEPDALAVESHLRWELARLTDTRAALLGREFPHPGSAYVSLYGYVWPPLILLDAGDRDGARAAFEEAARIPLDEVRRSWVFLHNVADLAEAAVRLEALDVARHCYETLLPYAGRVSVVSGLVCFGGAVDHHLGRLTLALGDTAAASAHLRAAVDTHQRLGAAPWASASQALLARTEVSGTGAAGSLVREGKTWRISWDRLEAHLPDSKGLRDLAFLLGRPGQEIHSSDLYAAQTGGQVPAHGPRGDDVIDAEARAAYRDRLADLERELAAAEADHDLGRAERAAVEREALIDELRRNFDLKGRPRRVGDGGERARKAVSARLREAIALIGEAHPELGSHLRESVRTGTFCSYQPPRPATWTVRQI